MSADADDTGRFAVLEDRVSRLRTDVRDHSLEDDKRFDKVDAKVDKVESKVDALSTKVVALTTTAALVGSAIGHWLFGGH